jgi:hypothetical protein
MLNMGAGTNPIMTQILDIKTTVCSDVEHRTHLNGGALIASFLHSVQTGTGFLAGKKISAAVWVIHYVLFVASLVQMF